ncbi:MAG TPA: YIP1 family protein [Thermoanaerobaculia bacterium]|nr:YIP1 family protein [Thermoanaerobaculia bacterium]
MTESSSEPGGALAARSWGRPLGVLVSPRATFESIARRPSWLPPLLILLVLFVVAQVLAMQKIDMEAAIRDAMERQNQPVDDAQVAQLAEMQSKVGVACNVVLFPAGMALVAAIFWGLANVAGGEIGFKRSLAVTGHALMPNAVSSLLTIPVILGRREIDPIAAQHGLLASHLGALAPEDAPAWVAALLARVDLFSLWSLALLALGFVVVARLSKGAAIGIVLLVWLFWIGLMVGLSMMGFAGGG